MPLRIAFDLDGVLADMDGELIRQAKTLFGSAPKRAVDATPSPADGAADGGDRPSDEVSTLDTASFSPRQQRKLWRHIEGIQDFWETLAETEPGVVARLAALAAGNRWETIFLTKRPATAGGSAQVQTQRWLEAKGFRLPSVYVVQGSRGRIASALGLDIVVDDRPENCFDVVVDSKARAILVWRGSPTQLPPAARRLGIGVVGSTNECLDVLTRVDGDGKAGESMMTRVLRALGLKESATA